MKNSSFILVLFITAAFGISSCSGGQDGNSSGKLRDDQSSAAKMDNAQVWELPEELVEISANVLMDSTRMACIQDNKGLIYIYNLKTRSIERTIHFAGDADYEGLALVNNVYYVLRSDGFIYEVSENDGKKPSVKTYDLPLTERNDTESLFYDAANNRLLVGVKEKDLTSTDRKGVYSFDLSSKTMSTDAVMQIGSDKQSKKGKKGSRIKPSDMAVHPTSGEVYILNGPESQLLIANGKGDIQKTIELDKAVFPQPEGLCFTPAGVLYISSEGGKKAKGVIAIYSL